MITKKTVIFCSMLIHLTLWAAAQDTLVPKAAWAVEARVTTYLQSGYDLGLFYYPKNTRFSVGALVARHDISGNTKELLFNSSDHDDLSMELAWIVSVQTRYHFATHKEGFFGEAGVGIEEFRISSNNLAHNNMNGFIAPALGYIWYPWQRDGFYVMPKVASVFIISREAEQTINGISYQLKSFFPAPSVTIGWKF